MAYKIAPSILAADFAKLGSEITDIAQAGADWIHFDVMDNHYVPNLSFGPLVCQAIKPYANSLPIDVHLMVEPVDEMISAFITAGADCLSFHAEASKHVHRSLDLITQQSLKAGLAFNPATSLDILSDLILEKLDYILIMAVNPGFGGQAFIPLTLKKIKKAQAICEQYYQESGKLIEIQVDGGVNAENIASIAKAGASIFVAGSAVFGHANRTQAIQKLRERLD